MTNDDAATTDSVATNDDAPTNDNAATNATGTLTCDCCGSVEADGDGASESGRWLGDDAPLEAELPGDLQASLGRILGEPPIETLGAWLAAVRGRAGEDSIDVDHLCHADGKTAHVGRMDGETYHFLCFYDAVALSALADEPVDIETESPGGTTIEARAVGTETLDVTPETAVFSFGIEEDVTPPAGGDGVPTEVYGAICPYVKAFPDRDAYESWAGTVSARTVGLPLPGATEIAAALVE